jgi:flagellar motility protein MotE (MotC chaperone)
MKKFLSLIACFLLSLSTYSQYSKAKIDYPKFETDSNGQKVIVMTIEQAQSLDNATDLLVLLEKQSTQIGKYDSVCIKVINDKEQVIASHKLEIDKLKEVLNNKDQQIKSLQDEFESQLKKFILLEEQVDNRQQVIDEKNLQIRKIKTKMVFGSLGGGIAIIGLLIVLLITH